MYVEQNAFPIHISARSNNKDWFEVPMPEVWKIMEDYLFFCAHAFNLEIFVFVLMSNHFHMIARTPEMNLASVMRYFMRETSRCFSKATWRTNHNWGANYKPTILGTNHYFQNSYKYIYRNPVRAGICKKVEDYPFSTLPGILGLRPLAVPMVEDTWMFNPNFDENNLAWLNTPSSPKHEDEMARALRHREFYLAPCRNTRKPSALETQLI